MKRVWNKAGMSERLPDKVPVSSHPPVVSIVGNSGSGKTTLLEKLIRQLKQRGHKVGTIKHDVHGFEMDRKGKDSWRHKNAGAATTIISSPFQIGMVKDVAHDQDIDEIVPLLAHVDIILTEGYKRGDRPKIEMFRPEVSPEPLCRGDNRLIALVGTAPVDIGVPYFAADDIEALAGFIIDRFGLDAAGFRDAE